LWCAKRNGLEGKVLVAFDIVAGGRVANPAIIFSDERIFEKTAMEFMSGVRGSPIRNPPAAGAIGRCAKE
jgi:TonB family protein